MRLIRSNPLEEVADANYQPAKLVRPDLVERDRYQAPLYEAIVEKSQPRSPATVFRGLEGYGESAEIHRSHLLTHDAQLVSPLPTQRKGAVCCLRLKE